MLRKVDTKNYSVILFLESVEKLSYIFSAQLLMELGVLQHELKERRAFRVLIILHIYGKLCITII